MRLPGNCFMHPQSDFMQNAPDQCHTDRAGQNMEYTFTSNPHCNIIEHKLPLTS